jgi:hypothetical protein
MENLLVAGKKQVDEELWGLPSRIKMKGMEEFDNNSGSTTQDPSSWVEHEGIQKRMADLSGGGMVFIFLWTGSTFS